MVFGLSLKIAKGRMIFLTIYIIHVMFVINEVQVLAKRSKPKVKKAGGMTDYSRKLWPNATIPYMIDCSTAYVPGAKDVIRMSMAAWEKRTCIKFVKRTNQKAYLLIRRHRGCWSDVGYRRGQVIISMGDGCEYKFVMMHELGHIIGFNHEHNRPDRDDYIDILWNNVANSMIKQFYRRRRTDKYDTGLPYDYSSIMHYRFKAFTKNSSLYTIEVKDKNSTENHHPYRYISDLDVQKTQEMYKCPINHLIVTSKKIVANKNHSVSVNSKNIGKEKTIMKFDSVIEVSLKSDGWRFYGTPSERVASIMVNGEEMSQNRRGLNVVLINYLSGQVTVSIVFDIRSKEGALSFGRFIENIPRRHYFLIVSKIYSFRYFQEAGEALRSIGGYPPPYIRPGSAYALVGYKGYENIKRKQVFVQPREKGAFLTMNISLAQVFGCQNDVRRCIQRAKKGDCKKYPLYMLKVCQRSCKTCYVGKSCVDENKKCKEWADKDFCKTFADYMLRHCKVSCKICRKALPALGSRKSINTRQRVERQRKNKRAATKRRGEEEDDDKDDRVATGKRCKDEKDLCRSWASHGRCRTDSWVKENCLISCYKPKLCDIKQVRPEGSCSDPLGIGWDKTLPDSAFNASSMLQPGDWNASASNARLYLEDDFEANQIGSWCADDPPTKNEWLRIDFGATKKITAIATQGRFRYYEHVKNYKISFSTNDIKWKFYTEKNRVKIFKGNCDHMTPMLNIFGKSIRARFLKIHPVQFYGGMCLRVELFGCTLR